MKYILSNYNFDCSWVKDYTDDYFIFDRSDTDEFINKFPKEKTRKVPNLGNVDYDRLTYLVENYNNLPEVFVLAKGNLFKYITKEEFDEVKNANTFIPLLTKYHKTIESDGSSQYIQRHGTDKDISFYRDDIYHEFNNSWYLSKDPAFGFSSFHDWAKRFRLPSPEYIPFAPGGNYILTRETVHKYSRDYYDEMRNTLPYCQLPGEAQLVERSYYLMWK